MADGKTESSGSRIDPDARRVANNQGRTAEDARGMSSNSRPDHRTGKGENAPVRFRESKEEAEEKQPRKKRDAHCNCARKRSVPTHIVKSGSLHVPIATCLWAGSV
ncbi:MAG: hypothetical protein ACXVCM_20380 [Ktedonobacteraceae bacterium]